MNLRACRSKHSSQVAMVLDQVVWVLRVDPIEEFERPNGGAMDGLT